MNELERRLKRSLTEVRDAGRSAAPSRKAVAKDELFRKMRRRHIISTTGGIALAGAAAAGAFLLFTTYTDRGPINEGRNLETVDLPAPTQAVVEVGVEPRKLSVGGLNFVWSANVGSNSVSRVDPATNEVLVEVDVGAPPGDISIARGPVFVALPSEGAVVEIGPELGEVLGAPIEIPGGPTEDMDLTVGDGALWIVTDEDVYRLDLDTRELATVEAPTSPTDVAIRPDIVRVLDSRGLIYQLDPDTGAEIAEPLEVEPHEDGDITTARGSIWYFPHGGSSLFRLDLETGATLGELQTQGIITDLMIDPEAAWVVSRSDASGEGSLLAAVNADSMTLSPPIAIADEVGDGVIAVRSLWLSLPARDVVVRLSKFD